MARWQRPPGAGALRVVRRASLAAGLAAAFLAGACALGPPPAASFERAEDARREGELDAAVEGYTRAIAAAEARRQFDVLFVATAHLADLYVTHPELGGEREGVNLWRRVLRQSEALFGADHPMTASAAYELGHAYVRIGDTASAEPVFARSVAILRAARPDSAETRDAENAWRGVRRQLGMEPELPAAPSPAPAPKPEGASGDGPEPNVATADPGAATGGDAEPDAPVPVDATGTYLATNVRDVDGTPAFVHVTPADMPLRIAIPRPPDGARDGSTRQAREAAIEAMRLWEEALRPALPWFTLEFVEKDPGAAVQVEWARARSAGGQAAGRGWLTWWLDPDGQVRAGGAMRLALQPDYPVATALTLEELRLLVAHEFGHVLGLGHCLDCDSAMNDSWHTRERVLVTLVDVATFTALVSRPNGLRVDGTFMEGVQPPAP